MTTRLANSLGEDQLQWRAAFESATEWFLEVGVFSRSCLAKPGLGEWSVRDLLGHTSRALITAASYLSPPAAQEPRKRFPTAAEYFVNALEAADPGQIAARGRESGAALGEDVAASLHKIAETTRQAVGSAPNESMAATPFGLMSLSEYLPTRTLELTIHTIDVARAVGQPVEPPRAAAVSTLRLLGDLAQLRGVTGAVAMALTGRHSVPSGFSVL